MPVFMVQALNSPNCRPQTISSDSVSAINHGELRAGVGKSLPLEFHCLEFQPAISLMSKVFASLLSTVGKHRFSLEFILVLTAFTGFHKESSRLLQGFDTYGYVYPNRGTMLVLPKTECPWQCNSLKSKFGRNDKW